MKLSFIRAMVVIAAAIFCVSHASAETCVDCHKKITPAIVTDWELSKHSKNRRGLRDMSRGQAHLGV